MKIVIGMTGAQPIAPDYAMLRAALIATQAATPTARRCATRPRETIDPHVALHRMFAGADAASLPAATLGHRFSSIIPLGEEEA